MASIDISSSIRIITLNCQGIKSNINYVNSLFLNECDIMFVCEHWSNHVTCMKQTIHLELISVGVT